MRITRLYLWTLFVSTAPGYAFAQDKIDFQRDIRPILSNQCFKCHGPALQKSGVRLDSHDAALKKKAIVPGKADASKLIERILADDDERMPPKTAGERLKPAQIELLKKWIAQGAEYTPHWAFIKPKQVAPPNSKLHPIDAFIQARLDNEGLKMSPEAGRPTLIRRLSLDLLGILPSPKEVDDFVHDQAPDAYEKLVDR
jgi:Protein of unknown function (DUF1549)/Planctomycete cytochrome C